MNILVAPDSFKGAITAREVCELAGTAIKEIYPDAVVTGIPVADGGEGTVDAFVYAARAEVIERTGTGPNGKPVKAFFGKAGKTAVIEMAAASGLPLAEAGSSPFFTSTYGTGELILAALDEGCEEIMLGLGGSATNDAGIGCLTALGVRFFDKDGAEATPDCRGAGNTVKIDASGLDERLKDIKLTLLCDVTNPLCGENGASFVFAPQKGASAEELPTMDGYLRSFSRCVSEYTGKDISEEPGAGAAGGLGYGLKSFIDAETRSGAETILDKCGFEEKAGEADFIFTGEGRFDRQSFMGKVPGIILKRAMGKPVTVFCGISLVDAQTVRDAGFSAIYETDPAHRPFTDEVRSEAKGALYEAFKRAARDLSYL